MEGGDVTGCNVREKNNKQNVAIFIDTGVYSIGCQAKKSNNAVSRMEPFHHEHTGKGTEKATPRHIIASYVSVNL